MLSRQMVYTGWHQERTGPKHLGIESVASFAVDIACSFATPRAGVNPEDHIQDVISIASGWGAMVEFGVRNGFLKVGCNAGRDNAWIYLDPDHTNRYKEFPLDHMAKVDDERLVELKITFEQRDSKFGANKLGNAEKDLHVTLTLNGDKYVNFVLLNTRKWTPMWITVGAREEVEGKVDFKFKGTILELNVLPHLPGMVQHGHRIVWIRLTASADVDMEEENKDDNITIEVGMPIAINNTHMVLERVPKSAKVLPIASMLFEPFGFFVYRQVNGAPSPLEVEGKPKQFDRKIENGNPELTIQEALTHGVHGLVYYNAVMFPMREPYLDY